MMNPNAANARIAEALGLNPNIVEIINLVFEANKAPAVIVKYIPSPAHMAALTDVLVEYQMVEKP